MDERTKQRMRGRLELFYGAPFGSPEAAASERELGLDAVPNGYYFAIRSSPMGAVGAAVVEASFYGFASSAVRAAVPAIWEAASPAEVIASHGAAVEQVMRRKLGDVAGASSTLEAAELLRTAVDAADVAGRPLAAGHKDLPWPAEPGVAIRHGLTVLREHRGDGHLAALLSADLDAPESHLLLAAGIAGGCACHPTLADRGDLAETLRKTRSHSVDAWAKASARMVDRGLLDADGAITPAGMELHVAIEQATDDAAAGPWLALGTDGVHQLDEALRPATRALASAQ